MKKEMNPEIKKKKALKRRIVFGIIAGILCVLTVVIIYAGYPHNKERIRQFYEIEGISGVKKVWQIPYFYSEKYILTFDQPLDWENPSLGTFPQRVEVAIRKDAPVTLMETDGYILPDKISKTYLMYEPPFELTMEYGGNYVHVEHRFFGDSRPADMSNSDTKYWEYHTAANAAGDYHRIYTSLSPILGDKWISYGGSRGGLMTNVYGYYYPEDMLVYVAYVAPCSDGMGDERFYKHIYTDIGDDAYGEAQGKERRDLVTAFQTEAIRYKQDLLPKFRKKISSSKYHYPEDVTAEEVYDMVVLEFAVQYWQQGKDFEKIRQILDMPDGKKKRDSVYKLLLKIQDPIDWSQTFYAWPYYVNTATTYGQYHYDFSYLRTALAKEGLSDKLTVTEDMEDGFLQKLVFTEEQRNAFVYDGSFHDALVDSMATTKAKHLMIFGGTDPWYGVAIPLDGVENENIRVFVNPTAPHTSTIGKLPAEMKQEAQDLLDSWVEPYLGK